MSRHATVVGIGLIGGSIGLALRERGWHVSGVDTNEESLSRALELGAIDAAGWDEKSEITFVATPVSKVASLVKEALEVSLSGVVTDAGSVKNPIVQEIGDQRFIGGHPMAGSEQEGVDGASATMFANANWVLTPTEQTDDKEFAIVREVVTSFGAEVVTLSPERHDALVATVSHVPHLTAATLMGLASTQSEEHYAVLRLAAGGFRDMTRIAAGSPGIWPDICKENSGAITEVLDDLIEDLSRVRNEIAQEDKSALLRRLETARQARISLPTGAPRSSELIEVRVPIPDRKGELAAIFALATDLDVNIYDLEMAHSSEGDKGVAVLIVEASLSERLQGGLMANGYRPTSQPLA